MDLEAFRKRIRELYFPTGYSQKMLARELGLQPTALSNKLNGTGETSLKHTEVKQIIKILAKWEALSNQAQAVELLAMMGLSKHSFTPEEWNTPPMNKLSSVPASVSRNFIPVPGVRTVSVQATSPFVTTGQLFEWKNKRLPYLPAQATSFIGRKQPVAQLLSLLRRADVRLVTLTGSGGVGKTRLALQLASELMHDFEDGVFFISLASVSDPKLVLSTIAYSLGIVESGTQTVFDLITNYLYGRRLLLVLDNFEQVLPASIAIKELMAELPNLKVLITSRILLHVYGEHEYILPPLSLPDPSLTELESLGSNEAIALFVQRARAALPNFKLSEENAWEVAEICRRLDGLPLAIELAATKIKTMGPTLILAGLSSRLELLNRGPRDLPGRQQTLRDLLDWSFDLLNSSEKQLLTRLSVFAGGCDLTAVAEVCLDQAKEANSKTISSQLLNKLSDLVDKSLLQIVHNSKGEPRFSMLETVREYTLEKLRVGQEEYAIYERHAVYFLKLVEAANQALSGEQQKKWLDKLEIEHDNFRVALTWTIANLKKGQAEKALKLVRNLWRFWQLHSHFKESQLTITDVLSQTAPYQVEPKLRAEVLQGAGVLFSLTDYPRARAFQQENLELRRKIHDEVGAITALIDLGWLALHQADFPQAAAYGEEGLNLARKLANKPQVAAALFVLSIVTLFQGDNTQAELYAQECLSIWQELGDQGSIASGFLQLGTISLKKGEYINARTRLVESLNMYLALGNKIGTISVLGALAELAMYHRSAYEGVQKAAVLLGAVESIRASLGFAMPPLPGSVHDARLAMVQSQLDPPTFSTAFHEGGRLELKEILALAQEDLELSVEALFSSPALDSSSNHSVGAPYPKAALNRGLTPREIEVLKLAATGVTTLKIAEELTVSPLTVQAHLRSIYSKLEVTSRSAATRYALENKLV